MKEVKIELFNDGKKWDGKLFIDNKYIKSLQGTDKNYIINELAEEGSILSENYDYKYTVKWL